MDKPTDGIFLFPDPKKAEKFSKNGNFMENPCPLGIGKKGFSPLIVLSIIHVNIFIITLEFTQI